MLREGPIRRRLRERREKGHSPQLGLTLSQIDSTIRDVQRYIEDEKRVERMYYMESQNPVIKAINASELFLEISKEERTHAQELEALLPKLKEKWSEVQRGLI